MINHIHYPFTNYKLKYRFVSCSSKLDMSAPWLRILWYSNARPWYNWMQTFQLTWPVQKKEILISPALYSRHFSEKSSLCVNVNRMQTSGLYLCTWFSRSAINLSTALVHMYSQIEGEECSDCEMMNSYSTEKIEPTVAIKVMADVNELTKCIYCIKKTGQN